jgi:hypothetical protein
MSVKGPLYLQLRSKPASQRTDEMCQEETHPRQRSRAAPAAPEDALWMEAPDFAVAQSGLRIQSSIWKTGSW